MHSYERVALLSGSKTDSETACRNILVPCCQMRHASISSCSTDPVSLQRIIVVIISIYIEGLLGTTNLGPSLLIGLAALKDLIIFLQRRKQSSERLLISSEESNSQ